MKAMHLGDPSSAPGRIVDIEAPGQPDGGELLIEVHAAGVTPTEIKWYPTNFTEEGKPRLHAIPGHEFSGRVAGLGNAVTGFAIGDEVYGMNDWFSDGATAEYCMTTPGSIALKPRSLTHVEAASCPIAALTAWQGLIERAKIRSGERVLIHGGAGAVGVFAIQLARLQGAVVITTASSRHQQSLEELGAEQVIDYRSERFDKRIEAVDAVFDGVGGETLKRSWGVLKKDGRMVTIAADSEGATDAWTKEAFFIVEPRAEQLSEMARLIDAGKLRALVDCVVPLTDAPLAYQERLSNRRRLGKVVVSIKADSSEAAGRSKDSH